MIAIIALTDSKFVTAPLAIAVLHLATLLLGKIIVTRQALTIQRLSKSKVGECLLLISRWTYKQK